MNQIAAETNVMHTVEADAKGSGISRRARALARRVGLDLTYLAAVFVTSILAFAIWVTTLTATVSLLVFVFGVAVWFASTYVYRWTTSVDRRLAGWSRGERIGAVYRRPPSSRAFDRLRCVTTDPQTWRDLGWLVLNSVAGFAAALVGLVASATVFGMVTAPLWWWAIDDPERKHGVLDLGIYTVHSTGLALLTTAIGVALVPVALVLNRGLVAGHSALAARILGPSTH